MSRVSPAPAASPTILDVWLAKALTPDPVADLSNSSALSLAARTRFLQF
jgi:hypothetical protein